MTHSMTSVLELSDRELFIVCCCSNCWVMWRRIWWAVLGTIVNDNGLKMRNAVCVSCN